MRNLWALLVFLLAISVVAQQAAPGSGPFYGSPLVPVSARQPVLLELFTSEGCASCPPAEKNLAYLQTEQPYSAAEIITLAFHVDYWDGLGWRDPFASPLFTQRQKVYDRKFRTGNIYTPQMVVDGDIAFVGSKLDKAEKAIERVVPNEKALVSIELDKVTLRIRISRIPDIEMATVYLAIAEDGLGSDVLSGDNAGKRLAHVAVTRSLTGVGRIEPDQTNFTADVPVQIVEGWDKRNLKAVVFVQENHSRKIYGVGTVRLAS